MATKKRKQFSDMLGEEVTRSPIKKKLPDTSDIKKIAEQEHADELSLPVKKSTEKKLSQKTQQILSKPKPVSAVKEQKRISRTTFDFPTPIHRAMKKAAADEYTTLKNYVVMLVRKDLEERGLLE